MYLVTWRTTLDDIPVRLCSTQAEAETVAAKLTERNAAAAANRMGLDLCSPCNVTIVRFRPNGLVRGFKVVRDIDSEQAELERVNLAKATGNKATPKTKRSKR